MRRRPPRFSTRAASSRARRRPTGLGILLIAPTERQTSTRTHRAAGVRSCRPCAVLRGPLHSGKNGPKGNVRERPTEGERVPPVARGQPPGETLLDGRGVSFSGLERDRIIFFEFFSNSGRSSSQQSARPALTSRSSRCSDPMAVPPGRIMSAPECDPVHVIPTRPPAAPMSRTRVAENAVKKEQTSEQQSRPQPQRFRLGGGTRPDRPQCRLGQHRPQPD